jgi:hypothetical protein
LAFQDPSQLLKLGEKVRALSFTASHDRLTLEVGESFELRANIEFVFCNFVQFPAVWRAGRLTIEPSTDGFMKISDGLFVVECLEAHRWNAGASEPAVTIVSRSPKFRS